MNADDQGLAVRKPTSLELRRSNNEMMDKTTAEVKRLSMRYADGDQAKREDESEKKVPELQLAVTIGNESGARDGSAVTKPALDEQTCVMFGQIIDNEEETWQLLSNAASWESSFPKEILSEVASSGELVSSLYEGESFDLPPGWKKVSDSAGSYYWNVGTGKTQKTPPTSETDELLTTCSDTNLRNVLSPDEVNPGKRPSGDSRDGHMFLVQSLGWLPMEAESLKPDISSAAVNSCIRLLSNNRSQIMDGVGVWGEGKDLMLLISDDQLKVVDPTENTILQTQQIKHIRLWGVGRDSAHDFSYVVRDPSTNVYKCHVFRCDAPAQSIAKQLHTVCSHLVKQKKLAKEKEAENDGTDDIPVAAVEPRQTFPVLYLGSRKVTKPTGITILKDAINQLTKDTDGIGKDTSLSVSASALLIEDKNGNSLVNCRMRCLSFMGVGEDVRLFGFISVLAGEATCHVIQCVPNAAKLALAVQEACMLRYQKAIDSKQAATSPGTPVRNKSIKSKVVKLFSGLRRSGS